MSGSWPTAGGAGGWVVRGAGGVAGAPLAGRPGGRHVDGRLPGVRLIEGRLIG
ncbi:hypothetical protein RGF97_32595 [Streptomyces roseicoloratus]|uniref:Uncharacterized protein n=1 Tax=Streptomyces roseicoloratus TaxID=2508722 RepID=A0ABY9S2D0_9ACTN|nr:hypothetical protein [Streptomyces roseicoloratus]WMX48592.1 hypothetical protein RGF97_32595 [Streptomyces roseicoloratus]